MQLEHLERVGRVVEPLPGGHEEGDDDVLLAREERLVRPDSFEVILDQIGVGRLAKAVVVQLVVLNVPRLDEHPVEPVDDAPPQAAHAELEPAVRARRALVEAAVANVVPDDRPARHRADRDQVDGQRVDHVPHGQQSGERARARPGDDLAQMRHVLRTLLRRELLAQLADVLLERLEVHLIDPRILRCQHVRVVLLAAHLTLGIRGAFRDRRRWGRVAHRGPALVQREMQRQARRSRMRRSL